MVDLAVPGRLVGGLVLLFANGFFVTTEFAMTRVRQFPEAEFSGHPGLERAWEMTERLEIYLSGCQVGITVSSVGLGVVAEPAVATLLAPLVEVLGVGVGRAGHTAISVGLALALINILHVIIGEQAPTYLGVERSRFVAKHGARPLYWWTRLTWPVIVFADAVAKWLLGLFGVSMERSWAEEEAEEGERAPESRAEVRRRVGESLSRLGLTSERTQEVLNALEIGERPVSEVMVPRETVVALSTDESIEENVGRMREHPHGRFPLVGEDLEDFRGIVYTPALLKHLDELEDGTLSLEAVAAPPMTVRSDATVAEVIDQFQANNQELALVVDRESVVGLVTSTDAFEEITGQLEDPLDEELPAA